MQEFEELYFENREEFRNWLKLNHTKSSGIWMIYFKKHVQKNGINYREALEEALCFGWIDSLIKKLDEDRYVRKFTPRTNVSNWSDVNKKIVLSLIKQGKMTEAGLKKIDVYLETGKVDWKIEKSKNEKPKKIVEVPGFILKELGKNEPALSNFNNLAPTHKLHFVLWITHAKREETQLSRLKEAVELLKKNQKLGLK